MHICKWTRLWLVAGTVTLCASETALAQAGGVAQPRMGDPLGELTSEQMDRFVIGRSKYANVVDEADGRGPIYNHFACGFCHVNPLGGTGTVKNLHFARVDEFGFDPLEEFGGPVRQELANEPECEESIPPEANKFAFHITNGALGYGLIEAIPDEALLALESPGPGVTGRAHLVTPLEDPGAVRVGRFGWKAQVATVLSFSADAAHNEIGLTNRLIPDELDPNGIHDPGLDLCDTVPDPEDGPEGGIESNPHFIDRVTDFQRFIAPPPQTPQSGMIGEALFETIGCGQCHVSSFTTSDDAGLEDVLRNKTIRPYSDFLLHDMGEAADGFKQLEAGTNEMRTPPLWGLRRRAVLWHDGRFDSGTFETRVMNAIAEHAAPGSEAVFVLDHWEQLTPEEQGEVMRFLDSLGRSEFDVEGDDVVELSDFLHFADCFFADGVATVTPDDPCAIHDIDQNGLLDLDDYSSFLFTYLEDGVGPQNDCNDNGEIDLTDIISGSSTDVDGNGVPDDCQTIPFLEIQLIGDTGPFGPGEPVSVSIWMRDLGVHEAVAYQAFLEFDPTEMTFVSGEYTLEPFGLPIIAPIGADGAFIDLAAGIDPLVGQDATSDDAPLVLLTFQAIAGLCSPTVTFREHSPPTRISTLVGAADPLVLVGMEASTCPADFDGSGDVRYLDILEVLANWGPCDGCQADLDCSGEVGFTDLLSIIAAWGPCP